MADANQEYRYNRLTWAEMNDAIGLQKVVLLPTGSTEQHGRHLPLDVDVFLCESVCLEVGRRAPDRVLVLPPVAYGLNLHHIDFPGTIHIEPEVFTESLCFATGYFQFLMDAFEEVRESEVIAHADEFETSLYLHLAPERVQMDKAAKGDDRKGEFVSSDSTSRYMRFNDYWGRWTDLGVHGDPRVATAEKGEFLFEAAVDGLVKAVDEIKAWPIEARRDQHRLPVQKDVRW